MKSPCVNVCVIDPISSFCIGCGRTTEEITHWTKYTDKQRKTVTLGLSSRLKKITKDRKRGSATAKKK